MENKCTNDIIVDLNRLVLNNNTLTSRNEFIHRDQLDEVCRIIREKIENAQNYDPNKINGIISQNEVISIFARRGAGKTTFVKSLVHLIRVSDDPEFVDIRKELHCVDVLEPNQVQKKEHLLIRLLAQINEVFNKELKCNEASNGNLCQQFEEASRKLYEALPVIEGVGSGNLFPEWDDNIYIADRYMNLATNVKDLEKRLHNYIHLGLKLLGKKALLFVLDDSDINIDRSFEILEIIRLYLTSPQIIVMLTGDAMLYGMIVRRNYWKYFDEEYLKKECESLDRSDKKFRQYQKIVYRLEAQYLQKLIKVEYRIFLNNVYDKLHLNSLKSEEDKANIYIKLSGEYGKKEIRELYKEVLDIFDIKDRLYPIKDTYINHFLAQPFRNQLRLFSVYDQYLQLKEKNTKELSNEILVKGFLKVFEIYINQHSGDSKFLMAHTPIYPAWLLKFLVENKILNIGSEFLPTMEDDSLKNAIVALCLSCTEQMKRNPSIIFDYLVRISMTKQLAILYGEDIFTDKDRNFLSFTNVYADCGLDIIMGKMLSYCNWKYVNYKNISIPGTIEREFRFSIYDTSSISSKLINALQIESVSPTEEITYIYSLYRPLAILGELLRKISDFKDSTPKRKILFFNHFNKLSQVKYYLNPNIENQYDKDENSPIDNDIVIPNTNTTIDNFEERLYKWCSSYYKLSIAPYLIDRTFSHYFNSMLDLSYHSKFDILSIGDFINKSVISLWNAIIVETINNLNIHKSIHLEDDVIIAFFKNYYTIFNLRLLQEDKKLFITWLLECPLLKIYVDPFILQLITYIKEKSITIEQVLQCLNFYKREINNSQYLFNIRHIDNDIEETKSKIKKYEEYNKIEREIYIHRGNIDILEGQRRSNKYSSDDKLKSGKQINRLMNRIAKLKEKQLQLGLFSDDLDIDDELRRLYQELYGYEKQKNYTESNKPLLATVDEDNDLYQKALNDSAKQPSVYNDLKYI